MDLWTPSPIPKKRTSRACDVCRRKKIRCDGADKPDNRCSNCISHNIECTYEAHAQRAAGAAHPGSLEERLMEMETKLNRIHRDHYPASLSGIFPNTKRVAHSADEELEQYGIPELSKDMEDLALPQLAFLKHYHGRTSSFSYYMMAKQLNRDSDMQNRGNKQISTAYEWKHRRERFWQDREKKSPFPKKFLRPSDAAFPHEELGRKLIAYFFDETSIHLILDRKDFESKYDHGEHHRDDAFAALVFVVFSISARYLHHDPAVLKVPDDIYSAGEAYIEVVGPFYRMFQGPINLAEFQGMTLFSYYQLMSGRLHPAWVFIGITLRLALDVGAHRKRPETPTRESEFWKRTFWMAYSSEVGISCYLGRVTTVNWNDIDIDFPAVVDEEHDLIEWIHLYLQLSRLMDCTIRMLYPVKRSSLLERLLKGEYEQTLVSELDSNLNEWFEKLPPRLKWDENKTNRADLYQSAQLYVVAYNLSQLIHRPFIPQPGTDSRLPIPSLAICTRAARACSNVLHVARKKKIILMPAGVVSAFASGITLIISSWSAIRAGSKLDYNTHLLDVDKCIRYMLFMEEYYVVSGRHVDILREMADFAGMGLATSADSPPGQKRQRGEEEDEEVGGERKHRLGPFPVSTSSPVSHDDLALLSSPLSSSAESGTTFGGGGASGSETMVSQASGPASGSGSGPGSVSQDMQPSLSGLRFGEMTIPSCPPGQYEFDPSSLSKTPILANSATSTSSPLSASTPNPPMTMWDPNALAALMPTNMNTLNGASSSLADSNNPQPSSSSAYPHPASLLSEPLHFDGIHPNSLLAHNQNNTSGDQVNWMMGQGAYLPQAFGGVGVDDLGNAGSELGAGASGSTQEALGLWAFAPPTFEWEQWGSMIDAIKFSEGGGLASGDGGSNESAMLDGHSQGM